MEGTQKIVENLVMQVDSKVAEDQNEAVVMIIEEMGHKLLS